MKKRNILVSFDGVLFQTRHLISGYMNWRYGLETNPEDWETGQPFEEILNSIRPNRPISRKKVYSDYTRGFFPHHKGRDFELFGGAKGTLKNLFSCYNLFLVTERPRSEKMFIENLLKRNGVASYFAGIHCAGSYFPREEKDDFKTSFLSSLTGYNMGYIDKEKKEVEKSLGKVFVPVLFCPEEKDRVVSFEKYEKARDWEKVSELFLFKNRE